MARPRSPNRDRAYKLWIESGKKRLLKDIAEELHVSEEQVRKWKNQDKWDKVTLPKGNSNVTNHKGGQPGNKNAAGNSGGAAPQNNKNALKTGEFEALFFDTLDQEEKQLLTTVRPDKEQLLLQEIQLLTVRERRMLKRIDSLRSMEALSEQNSEDGLDKAPLGLSIVKYKSGIEKGKATAPRESEGILGQIQAIEEALTRVQAKKQKAIEALHKFGYDDTRLELETMKLELMLLKQGGQDDGTGDDGFMEAMNEVASQVWGEEDDE